MLPHPARMCKHMRWGLMQRFLNARYDKDTVHIASIAQTPKDESGWLMKQERHTPRYTKTLAKLN
ncbi:DUF4113 domain-containing protein [Comamonas kerstersii]|uniref:DUF4113 domain-containing protein n=1 Tax=Comamonas kerstersii TaxID=225992 RepID=A0A6A1QUA5_9BURK|nr:DUF4113 domain-containing protein [Comamonas kerstersii]